MNRKYAPPVHPATLDDVLHSVWTHLRRGVADRRHPFRTATLATMHPDGYATARTVVLRDADRAAGQVVFHTDTRSPKWSQLQANPRATLLLYHRQAKLQVRLTLEVDGRTDEPDVLAVWQRMNTSSRGCYRVDQPPGTPVDHFDDPHELAESDDGRYFARCFGNIVHIDALYLAAAGHRRAQFDTVKQVRTWVTP